MLKRFIQKVVEREDLNEEEAREAMSVIMGGETPPTQIASFLTALRMKGETSLEITGFASAMRERAIHIHARNGKPLVDTCGTGGDGSGTFNISTAAAFVAAGAGLAVAKHGNRSVSSRCGSADVLEALGVNINLSPEKVEACLNEMDIAFLFAPLFHPAMKYALGPRKEIGIRTVFNFLGPLTNPAGARIHLLGVYRKEITKTMAEVLKNLGSEAAFVVHGEDHADEISITGKTTVSELRNGVVKSYEIEPEEAGLKRAGLEAIRGGTPRENADRLLRILRGEDGPARDVVLLNVSAVLLGAGMVRDLKDGVRMAGEAIDSGQAMRKLNELIRFTNSEG